MTRDLTAVESQPIVINLTEVEASILASLGRELASSRGWWGGKGVDETNRSVIAVERQGVDRCLVTFRDVIGVVRVGALQIEVAPKIPSAHFLYLASRSAFAPRVAPNFALLKDGFNFIELLARWCVDATENLLRQGLRKDYTGLAEDLAEVRGSVLACETVMNTCQGRAVARCEFEELSDDAPLNRIVRSACERIARLDSVTDETRRRARRGAYRMDGVGQVQFSDMRTKVDRLSSHYSRVIPLASLILAGCGISSSLGGHVGSAFLIRTPEVVEDGLRAVLSDAMPDMKVVKRRLMLDDTGLSMNPDLVIGANLAVGDVKYRFLGPNWNRADLNQVIAFATAFRSRHCGLFGFIREPTAARPRPVPVGSVHASAFTWIASASVHPSESAALLSAEVKAWVRNSLS